MPDSNINLVFVHGWSVSDMTSYGELPLRIKAEAAHLPWKTAVHEIVLSRYLTFHDEVRMQDIAVAFQAALREQLRTLLERGERFICITHSAGGPAIRTWWQLFCKDKPGQCPMSHLIMLAPANFGSALAQLGKSRISRLKSWLTGVEPGQGVLDWLELGSDETWNLNAEWIRSDGNAIGPEGFFPFVITGQWIDRKLYDYLNAYTGELGTDGVVRVAAANLNARLITLVQQKKIHTSGTVMLSNSFEPFDCQRAPETAFRLAYHRSHMGSDMGIMGSVRKEMTDADNRDTVGAILECIGVQTSRDYHDLMHRFASATAALHRQEQLETETTLLLHKRYFIHDRFTMVIFRVHDQDGRPVEDFDLVLTSGKENSPDLLPEGFFVDRQRNSGPSGAITYYLNYDLMKGSPAVTDPEGTVLRAAVTGTTTLGLSIYPRPVNGFVHYAPCHLEATEAFFEAVIVPDATALVDICMQRLVDREVFRVEPLIRDHMPSKAEGDFSDVQPGGIIG